MTTSNEELLHNLHFHLQDIASEMQDYYFCITGQTNPNYTFGQCYIMFDSLTVGLALCVAFIVYSFVWSIIGNNCSKVDQIWSITPCLFCWHFFYHHNVSTGGEVHYRLLLMSILVSLWGSRLTFNFWRKGGYGTFFTHEEDYRWPILRAKMHSVVFLIFNFSFIAVYQNLLLFWIAAPAFEVMKGPTNIGLCDIVVALLFSTMLIVETIADEQHWIFQTFKHSLTEAQRSNHPNMDIRQGFYQSGLFRYSRHPNYFAEQSLWVAVYLFSLTTLPFPFPSSSAFSYIQYLNWSGLGCVQLILLFQGSMTFGESITLSKYPAYRAYQASTSRCLPLPISSSSSSASSSSSTTKTAKKDN